MRPAPRTLTAVALLAGSAALAGPAAAQFCTPAGFQIEVPKGYSVQKIEYLRLADAPVRATLWSERLGPRTTDDTVSDLPKGDWTAAQVADPAVLQYKGRPWRMGVEAAYTGGDAPVVRPFECVVQELHPSGTDPWGYVLMSFIEREADPGRVDFQVKVTLHRGPLVWPKPVKTKAVAVTAVKPAPPLAKKK
jgi:hypothetical protein